MIHNKLSPSKIVASQIPRYLRENNPLFVKFMQYYYEFIEQSKIQDITQDALTYNDNDSVELEFLNNFYEEMKGLPSTITADPRLVAKFIYDLYKSKGTEAATALLFKILYGEDITVTYPSENILRASVGNWVRDTILTVTVDSGNVTDGADSIRLTSIFGSSSYKIDSIEPLLNSTVYRIHTRLPSGFNVSTSAVEIYSGDVLDASGSLIDTPDTITITTGGLDWKVGQLIIFPSTSKSTIAQIKKVSAVGSIQQLRIVQYGYEDLTTPYVVSPYDNQIDTAILPPPTIPAGTYNDSKATLQLTFAIQSLSDGRFKSLDGMLSVPTMNLQDNFFYQVYSYVIKSQHQIPEFENALKMIHPAGVKYFAESHKESNIVNTTYDVSFSADYNILLTLYDTYGEDGLSTLLAIAQFANVDTLVLSP